MARYTDAQLKQLRNRWRGYEAQLGALIGVIKADEDWHKSEDYKSLREALGQLPEGVEEVQKDLRGANLAGAHLEGAQLWGAHLEGANLRGAYLEGANLMIAQLGGADLWGAHLEGANLWGALLANTERWFGVTWNPQHRSLPRVKRFDLKARKLEPFERKTVFGANDVRNANWAGAALLERYVKDENFLTEYIESTGPPLKILSWRSWRDSFPRLPRKIWLRMWKWTCNYGRSFWRWAVFSALLAVVFATIYWLLGCDRITFNVDKLDGIQPDFKSYLYYSVVTFTTLGFGDIVPLTNWARLVVGAEVFIGYVMLGGLISIFANKLARRA